MTLYPIFTIKIHYQNRQILMKRESTVFTRSYVQNLKDDNY